MITKPKKLTIIPKINLLKLKTKLNPVPIRYNKIEHQIPFESKKYKLIYLNFHHLQQQEFLP